MSDTIYLVASNDVLPQPSGWCVICPDHKLRHGTLFPTRAEADTWAYWGHACVAHGHKISAAREYVAVFPKAKWADSFAGRLVTDWSGFRAFRIEHTNGRRKVTWHGPDSREYYLDLAETVGYYGSPPQGPVATLNGIGTPRSY